MEYRSRTHLTTFAMTQDFRAHVALLLVEKHALTAAEGDGEDSAGRQKIKRATPAEVVEAACTTADLFVTELERCGWISVDPRSDEDLFIERAEIDQKVSEIRFDAERFVRRAREQRARDDAAAESERK